MGKLSVFYYKLFALIFIFGLIAASGCLKAKVNYNKTSHSEYPSSKYMTAKGMGQTEPEADKQAIAELSQIFESKVISSTFNRIRSIVDPTGNEIMEKKVESNIRVVSAVQLKGAQIGKRWFDKKNKLYHALAVLDRYKARQNWQNELENIDIMIEGEFKSMNSIKSKLMKVKSLRKIQDLWIKREVIVSRLRVLGFEDVSAGSYDMRLVFHLIPKIKAEMLIFVELNGEHSEWIEDKVSESISKRGLVITDTRAKANVLVIGSVKAEPVKLNNPGWEFARVTVSLSIIDSDTEITVGELSENTRAGHLNYIEAVNKAVKKVSSVISDKLIIYFDKGE